MIITALAAGINSIFPKDPYKQSQQQAEINGLKKQLQSMQASYNRTRRENTRMRHILHQINQHEHKRLKNSGISYNSGATVINTTLLLSTIAIMPTQTARHQLIKQAPPDKKHQARNNINFAIKVYEGKTIEQANQEIYDMRSKSMIRHKKCSYKP